MASLLTQRVFRRLIANRPIVHRDCLRRNTPSSLQNGLWREQPSRHVLTNRHFFNLFGPQQKRQTEAEMAPGIKEMEDLRRRQRVSARLPSREEVASAIARFFRDRVKRGQGIGDSQIDVVLPSLEFCEANADGSNSILETQVLLDGAKALLLTKSAQVKGKHMELASEIYSLLDSVADDRARSDSLNMYCKILVCSGRWTEARDAILKYEKAGATPTQSQESRREEAQSQVQFHGSTEASVESTPLLFPAWMRVLDGAVAGGDENELLHVYNLLEHRNMHDSAHVTEKMLSFYQANNDVEQVQKWWDMYMEFCNSPNRDRMVSSSLMAAEPSETGSAVAAMLKWCYTHKHLELGHRTVAKLLSRTPTQPVWNAIFVWAAANGKGVEEIDRMIGIMEESNQKIRDKGKWRRADVSTINQLVEFAISKRDPYLAERFIILGQRRNIEPNHRTYALQLDYRLSINDVDGALSAYKGFQTLDFSSSADEAVINRLLVALCKSGSHDFDTIMNVAADLSDRKGTFEAQTVSCLAGIHLARDEMHDVVDLINTHASDFSIQERAAIAGVLAEFCMHQETSTAQAWETYGVLRELFDEINRDTRTALMKGFLKRKRPDLAVRVFNHMRMHSRDDTVATGDTYIAMFLGIEELRNPESLEVVHNQLKLDYNIEPNTLLRNALMLAYIACNKTRSALSIWDQIVATREGPSFNSIHIAFRACERAAFGDVKAHEIWEVLRRKGVEFDNALWTSYASAIAGNGKLDEIILLVEQAEDERQLHVNYHLLACLLNAAPNIVKQEELSSWIARRWPSLWEDLENSNWTTPNGVGQRLYDIDRSLTP